MWTNRRINLRTLVTVVKQYIYVNNIKKNLNLNLNIVNQITIDGFKIEIMLLKNCRYLEYENQRKAICEKCHARTNFVLTYSFFNIEWFFFLSLKIDKCFTSVPFPYTSLQVLFSFLENNTYYYCSSICNPFFTFPYINMHHRELKNMYIKYTNLSITNVWL